MHQAIPYSSGRPWLRPAPAAEAAVVFKMEAEAAVVFKMETAAHVETKSPSPSAPAAREEAGEVARVVAESPVLVVGKCGCCLSHVVKQLLQGLGANPAVHEVADEAALAGVVPPGGEAALPAVFVGGKLLGGLDRLMAVHISGELVPILKKAGALWL